MAKVLIVEDQSSVSEVVKHHLEGAGYQVYTADNAESGWRGLITHSPDAALIDIRLPGPDGWSLIERMRGDGRFADTPALVLTGLLEAATAARAAELGCVYMSKPFAASDLVGTVQGMLRSARNGHALEAPDEAADSRNVQFVAHRAIVLMDHYQIRGTIYVPAGLDRFSDAWEALLNDGREFIPVTDATITSPGQSGTTEASFVQVRKQHIRAIFPREDER